MNIKEYKVPKILFIKGVFIKDCIQIDDLFEQQIIEQLNQDEDDIIIYNKIPSTFTCMNTWPTKTNIKCWTCDLNFDGVPVFIPKLIEPSPTDSGYSMGVLGCFCGFTCAMTHNNLFNGKLCQNIKSRDMLMFLYNIFLNHHVKEIYESPSKYMMKQYGGDVDPISYKKLISKLEKKMKDES
jgi:hypothetical protein